MPSFPIDHFHYKSVGHLTNKPTLHYIKKPWWLRVSSEE